MPAPSFSPPTWATSNTPAAGVLPSQIRLDGYAPFDIPSADGMNRWRYEVGEYLTFLHNESGAPFAVEHYATADTDAYGAAILAGSHGAMTADSLTIRGSGSGAGAGGTLTFRDAGRASDNTATIAVGAVLAETVILQFGRAGSAVNVQAELDGGVWRSTLQGGATWAMEVNSASDKTLYVRNTGAGVAGLDVEGVLTCNGVASFPGDVQGTGGTLTCLDQLAAEGGLSAGLDSDNCALRYLGASPQVFEQDVSPYAGGWVPGLDAATNPLGYEDGTPPYAYPDGTNTNYYRRPLAMVDNAANPTSSPARRHLTGIKVRYYRTGAGDTLTLEVVRVRVDGTASEDVLLTYDETTDFTTTGAWTLWDSGAIGGTDFNCGVYYYFLRIKALNLVRRDLKIGSIRLSWDVRHVEAAPF